LIGDATPAFFGNLSPQMNIDLQYLNNGTLTASTAQHTCVDGVASLEVNLAAFADSTIFYMVVEANEFSYPNNSKFGSLLMYLDQHFVNGVPTGTLGQLGPGYQFPSTASSYLHNDTQSAAWINMTLSAGHFNTTATGNGTIPNLICDHHYKIIWVSASLTAPYFFTDLFMQNTFIYTRSAGDVITMDPRISTLAGGAVVQINGTNLNAGTQGDVTVALDGVDCPVNAGASNYSFSFSCTNAAVTAHANLGLGNVVISSSSGIITRTNFWSYNAGVIREVIRNEGPLRGGTYVTINGVNFGDGIDVTEVLLGTGELRSGVAANIVSQTSTQIVITTGRTSASVVGQVSILSTSLGHTLSDPLNPAVVYTYQPRGIITSIFPTEGPKQGGTLVTITGSNLANEYHDVCTVTFNEVVATVLTQTSTELTVITGDGTYFSGKQHVIIASRSHGITMARDSWTYLTGCCWRHPHAVCTVPADQDPACQGIVSFIDDQTVP